MPDEPEIAREGLIEALDADPLKSSKYDPDAVGLCLSGGGYKAAIYHIGALCRLNELGLLPEIDRISSVSGGSITSAWLGLRWHTLAFDPNSGVATNFKSAVIDPMIKFATSAKIDVGSVLSGVLDPFSTAAQKVAKAYSKHLYDNPDYHGGAKVKTTLQDLPTDKSRGGTAPRFIINVSSLQTNSLWRLSKPYMANYEVGLFETPNLRLSEAVAASSAFPPILAPARLNLEGLAIKPGTEGPFGKPPYSTKPYVADGGIYDNLGLETVWKRCGIVLVSNAGDPFAAKEKPPSDWVTGMRRIVSMMHRNEENHRIRWLMSLAKTKQRTVALWPLRAQHTAFHLPDSVGLSDADAQKVADQAVRLKPLSNAEALRLYQHGYSMCDASVRCFWKTDATPPAGLPTF